MVSDNSLVAAPTLREAVRGYLISPRASRYSPRYIEGMEMSLRLLADYGDTQRWPGIASLAATHIEEYLAYPQERPRWFRKREATKTRPVSSSHVETQCRRIKTFFRWLVERGHVSGNPLDPIKHPRVEERVIPTVAEEQLLDLLELVNPRHGRTPAEKFWALRNRALIWLLIDTPVRRAELAGLRIGDADLDNASVKVMRKGRRERVMPLGEACLLALWEYLRVRCSSLSHLWLDEHGRPLAAQAIYILLKRLGERAGIPNLHTHRFRHTFATGYLHSGGSERLLRLVGGWRRILN